MKPHALVVDDSLTVRMDLRIVLGGAGFVVTACGTKEQAQRMIRSRKFDLVILDVLLPDGDGIDIVRELRNEPAYVHVPIIVLSQEVDVKDRLYGLVAGADEYMGKPYDVERIARRATELVGQRAPSSTPDSAKGKKVLVVDDSPTYLAALAEVLRQDGHEVISASSGEEALQLLAVERVDGVILDLVMPGMGGMAAARQIKEDPLLQSIPIMLLTGTDDRRTRDEGERLGAEDYVLKSPELSLLKVRIRGLLTKRGRASLRSIDDTPPSSRASAVTDVPVGSLFAQVIAACGLSSVIGPSTISRACRRAGVDAQTMTPAELGRALPMIRDTLRVFLPLADCDRCVGRISELAEGAEEP